MFVLDLICELWLVGWLCAVLCLLLTDLLIGLMCFGCFCWVVDCRGIGGFSLVCWVDWS